MQISPEVLKNIKRIVFLEYEPNDKTVMWAKPSDSGEFVFLVYNNGAWQQLSGTDGVTINISDVSVNLSAFNNDVGFVTEDDIPTWAKQTSKPTYTASEVGALSDTTTLADLEDDTHKTVTPTEKATWNAKQDALTGYAEETFVFTLADDSTVTKTLLVK